MYPISNAVKALFDAEQRQTLRITGTDKNGASISITDANLMENTFSIDRFSCIGNKLEIGTACAAELTLKLDNRQGQFNNIVFEGAELYVEIGIADWSQDNPTVNYVPCGYFTSYEQPRSLSTITLHALDRMMRFDAVPPIAVPWTTKSGQNITDSNGNIIYFLTNIVLPATVNNLIKQVCVLCNVPFTQNITSFPNYNYTIASMPELQQQPTFRNIIQWCAGILGANAWIDWTGSLRFSWYDASTGYTMTTANRFSSDLHEDDITITGVKYTNTQDVMLVSGSNDYALDMTGNYLAASGISTILPNVKNVVNGFTYRPFTAAVINAPYLWPMDMVTFTDKDGNNHTCALTNVNFGINCKILLESRGDTAQILSGTSPNGMTTEQGFFIEKSAENMKQLDANLDQEGIFNRLTNNGSAQGIFLDNGDVYMNATYIQTGTLNADRIEAGSIGGTKIANGAIDATKISAGAITTEKISADGISADVIEGGTLTLGGSNNTNGTLTVKNASGTTIGTWNNNGISVGAGSITGGSINGASITLGGSNNTSGTLTIKDNSGNTIGTWNNNGISATRGTFSGTIESGSINGDLVFYADDDETFRLTQFVVNDIAYVEFLTNDSTYEPLTLYNNWVEVTNFRATGTKSRVVSTDQYSDRLLYCYETPTPMFGDIGEGTISDDGRCYVWLDPVFAQTIATEQYQVFLQRYGNGDCYVSERRSNCFIVIGTPGLQFGWEIKAKQRDYDQKRLDKDGDNFNVPNQTYGADAVQHIQDIQKERV